MKRFLCLPCLGLLLGWLPCLGAAPDEVVSTASLLREEADFSRLPLHRNWAAHLDSSCDKTGGNKDCQQFLSMEGETALLADLHGPGALVRIWSTAVAKGEQGLSSTPTGILKIYLDDNPVPVIDMPFGDLFKGGHPPFVAPLTYVNASANYTYLPIPYAKHCRVIVDQPDQLFYQIDSLAFPAGTQVRPFALPLSAEDEEALKQAQAAWTLPVAAAPAPEAAKLTIAAGATAELPAIAGPATIRNLILSAPDVSDVALRKLVLRVRFDGHRTPDIEAPVADFFGNAYGHKVFDSLFFSQNAAGEMSFRLPMPFRSGARVSVENGNAEPVTVGIAVDARPGPVPPDSLYLRADFSQEITVKGKAHTWARVEGHHGHFVGVVQTMQGTRTLGYCEGDDQVRVDDEKFLPSAKFPTVVAPSNGTGTEDCFNSAWYFSEGVKVLPVSGCVVRQDFGRIDAFRFFLNDAPVFQQSLDAQIEIGGLNDSADVYYSSVAFWYGDGERTPVLPMPAAATLGFPQVSFQGSPIVIEGESLVPVAVATGGTVQQKAMVGFQDVWSGDAELLWSGAKAGDTLTLPFDVEKEGYYNLRMLLYRGPAGGGYKFTVNGVPLSRDFDGMNKIAGNVGPVDFGGIDLPAGTSHLTVTLTGGTALGLDALALRPANKPKPPAPAP